MTAQPFRVLPRDIRPGDVVERGLRLSGFGYTIVRCEVTEVCKRQTSWHGTVYVVYIERPADVSPNRLSNRFNLTPQKRITVYREVTL